MHVQPVLPIAIAFADKHEAEARRTAMTVIWSHLYATRFVSIRFPPHRLHRSHRPVSASRSVSGDARGRRRSDMPASSPAPERGEGMDVAAGIVLDLLTTLRRGDVGFEEVAKAKRRRG